MENGKLPEGVSITYKSICKNGVEGTGENGRKCSNISIGDEVLLFCFLLLVSLLFLSFYQTQLDVALDLEVFTFIILLLFALLN